MRRVWIFLTLVGRVANGPRYDGEDVPTIRIGVRLAWEIAGGLSDA